MSLKKRALRRTKTLARDPETQEAIRPGWFAKLRSKIKAPFTHSFWEDLLETTENEKLVDAKLLSYSYLEAGFISAISA
jgi:sodium/potassium-transporting ATPase subunit alpha